MALRAPALLAAAALTFAAPALAQDGDAPTADTVIATVNGTEITLAQMIMIRAGLPEQYQQLPPQVLFDGILDQIVRQEVLAQDDRARETLRVTSALTNERRALLAAETIGTVADEAVTEAALRAAYEETYEGAEQGTEYDASHILVETEAEAAELVQQARDGADFAALATEHSTGPSGPNGGALGWFGAGQMVAPFEEAVMAMQPGEISDPVQTQFGWHVIRLNDTRIPEAPGFEEVRDELANALQTEAVNAFIEERVGAAEISRPGAEVDPAILLNLDLLEEE